MGFIFEVQTSFQLSTIKPKSNGPFALTGHMVQNPPYWMAKECSRFENKGFPTCQAQLSFVFDVPVENATFFCHPVWRILYHVACEQAPKWGIGRRQKSSSERG